MYKEMSTEEYKNFLSLPATYQIEGFLTYGAWDDEKHHTNIKSALESLGISYKAKMLDGFLSRIMEITIDSKIYWFAVVYGGALLSEYVHLASLFGSKKNIHIGSCGGLYSEMESLDLLIPIWSYGDESTTRSYARDVKDFKHIANDKLSNLIKNNISDEYNVLRGPVMTNQAMLGETWDDIKEWSANGYYGVEMETAVIFAVSNHFDIPSASLLYNSDNLIKGQTVGDDSHVEQTKTREDVKAYVFQVGVKSIL